MELLSPTLSVTSVTGLGVVVMVVVMVVVLSRLFVLPAVDLDVVVVTVSRLSVTPVFDLDVVVSRLSVTAAIDLDVVVMSRLSVPLSGIPEIVVVNDVATVVGIRAVV